MPQIVTPLPRRGRSVISNINPSRRRPTLASARVGESDAREPRRRNPGPSLKAIPSGAPPLWSKAAARSHQVPFRTSGSSEPVTSRIHVSTG